jgi:hypothetical protein
MLTTTARLSLVIGLSLGLVGSTAVAAQAAPAPRAEARSASSGAVAAAGQFSAAIEFTSISLRDAPGGTCELTVDGTLAFSGTLDGEAQGTTTAVIFAPCADVAITPPGTFFDLFEFEGTFTGTVDGSHVVSELTYAGITRPGGDIDALITMAGDARAVLQVDAVVAQGGTYTGIVHV